MKAKITAATVGTFKLPVGKTECTISDTEIPGLLLRLRAGGRRTIEFRRGNGARVVLGAGVPESFKTVKNKTTGEVLQLGVRERAAQLNADFVSGKDPAASRIANKRRSTNKIIDLTKRYLPEKKNGVKKDGSDAMRPGSYTEVERHILKHGEPLLNRPITSIDLAVAVEFLDEITASSGATASDRVRSSWSAFYEWAIRKSLVPMGHNPFAATAKNGSKPRERVPNDGELAEIWRAAGEDQYADIVRLLMLTGCRAGEIAGLRWSEIVKIEVPKARRDGIEHPAFMIDACDLPPERMKAGKRHIVPLSGPALAIIHRQPKRVDDAGNVRDMIFGAGQGPFSDWSGRKKKLDGCIHAARVKAWVEAGSKGAEPEPIKPWVLHDFRRSIDTGLGDRFGIDPHVTAAILAHTSSLRSGKSGSDRHYNFSEYLRERVEALRLWSAHIMALTGGNVVPLRQVAP